MERDNRCFLGNHEIDTIVKTLKPVIKKYDRGELLFRETDRETKFYLLLGGTAYLAAENEYGFKQILNFFTKGQILFHDMMIAPHNGHCYAIAKSPCTIALIDPADIEKYRQTHKDNLPDHLPAFISRSALYMTQQHCHILQQKTIRSKFLTFLYCQAERQRTLSVKLPVPYSDLADYLSVDRSALMKEIGKLCQENLIEKKSRQITILTTTPWS